MTSDSEEFRISADDLRARAQELRWTLRTFRLDAAVRYRMASLARDYDKVAELMDQLARAQERRDGEIIARPRLWRARFLDLLRPALLR
jgi:hypothetical protein